MSKLLPFLFLLISISGYTQNIQLDSTGWEQISIPDATERLFARQGDSLYHVGGSTLYRYEADTNKWVAMAKHDFLTNAYRLHATRDTLFATTYSFYQWPVTVSDCLSGTANRVYRERFSTDGGRTFEPYGTYCAGSSGSGSPSSYGISPPSFTNDSTAINHFSVSGIGSYYRIDVNREIQTTYNDAYASVYVIGDKIYHDRPLGFLVMNYNNTDTVAQAINPDPSDPGGRLLFSDGRFLLSSSMHDTLYVSDNGTDWSAIALPSDTREISLTASGVFVRSDTQIRQLDPSQLAAPGMVLLTAAPNEQFQSFSESRGGLFVTSNLRTYVLPQIDVPNPVFLPVEIPYLTIGEGNIRTIEDRLYLTRNSRTYLFQEFYQKWLPFPEAFPAIGFDGNHVHLFYGLNGQVVRTNILGQNPVSVLDAGGGTIEVIVQDNRLFAHLTGTDTLYYSPDEGTHWNLLSLPQIPDHIDGIEWIDAEIRVYVDDTDERRYRLWRSFDEGNNWVTTESPAQPGDEAGLYDRLNQYIILSSSGFEYHEIFDLLTEISYSVGKGSPLCCYQTTYQHGVAQSSRERFVVAEDRLLLAHVFNQVRYSTDYGVSFQKLPVPLTNSAYGATQPLAEGGSVYATTQHHLYTISERYGLWRKSFDDLPTNTTLDGPSGTFSGRIFVDQNDNCMFDEDDTIIPHSYLTVRSVHGNQRIYANAEGYFASDRYLGIVGYRVEPQGAPPSCDTELNQFQYISGVTNDTTVFVEVIFENPGLQLPNTGTSLRASVFPNPTTGRFVLRFESDRPGSAYLTDAYGRMVGEVIEGENHFADLADGVYFIHLAYGDSVEMCKVVLRQ